MHQLNLNEAEIETLIYALTVAAADLRESIADASQSAEDKETWSTYVAEIEDVAAKLSAMSEAA